MVDELYSTLKIAIVARPDYLSHRLRESCQLELEFKAYIPTAML